MARRFIDPKSFARRAARIAEDAARTDAQRLKRLGEKIARAKTKRALKRGNGALSA